MTNEVKVAITNAVYEVYEKTSTYDKLVDSKIVTFLKPSGIEKTIKIVRSREDEPIYELYLEYNHEKPFMTVFGCWPIGFVSDIFIKALEHVYDWY